MASKDEMGVRTIREFSDRIILGWLQQEQSKWSMVTSSTAKMKIKHFLFSLFSQTQINEWIPESWLRCMKALQEVASGLSMTDMSDIMTWETPKHDITVSCQDMPLLWQRPTWKYFQSASHQSYSATAAHKCIEKYLNKSFKCEASITKPLLSQWWWYSCILITIKEDYCFEISIRGHPVIASSTAAIHCPA